MDLLSYLKMSILKKMRFLFSGSDTTALSGNVQKHATAELINTNIRTGKNGKVIIGENVVISGYTIMVFEGELHIGAHTKLERGANAVRPSINIENGQLHIADHCIIRAEFSVRFGAICKIGSYTGIMEGTEIRADEKVTIGDFNMISYECMVYDTNTHCVYPAEVRREKTIADFPYIGKESDKPITKPVAIGNDCWLGKRSVVLKGVTIGNFSTVAACAVVTKDVTANHLAYGNPACQILKA
jgi:acetyltransferase-like isoleucine patch superfamily enzyme